MTVATLVRKPSGVLPIAMSALAFVTVISAVTLFGARPQRDEGAATHIFQILIAGQLPFLAWFAIQWLRRDFKGAASVIGLQIAAIAIALLPVWYLGL